MFMWASWIILKKKNMLIMFNKSVSKTPHPINNTKINEVLSDTDIN